MDASLRDEIEALVDARVRACLRSVGIGEGTPRRAGQTPSGVPLWLAPRQQDLGRLSDRDLARQLQVTEGSIRHWRNKLGLPPAPPAPPAPPVSRPPPADPVR